MSEDEQLEQIIKERNEFEREGAKLRLELGAFKNSRNWTRPYDYTGTLINEHAIYIPKLDIEAMRAWHTPEKESVKENDRLKSELGEMCEAMINMFNGGWDEEHQKCIDEESNRLINKNKQYVSE
tara:strand:+ start:194 stop:568 length:375 start_codon:yes stop_codon:yes gene_type:complete